MVRLTGNGELVEWDEVTALQVVTKVHTEGDPVTPADVDLDLIENVPDAILTYRAAKAQARYAQQVAGAAGQRLAELLGEDGAARVGDDVLRYRVPRSERCLDPGGVVAYLTTEIKGDRVDLADVINPTYIKRSWMSDAVRQTFYVWEEGDHPTLATTIADKAPQWLTKLLPSDGDYLQRRNDED